MRSPRSLRIWEWTVDKKADYAAAGVSGTRPKAMQALSETLIAAGAPASGRIVPVALIDGAHGYSYLRLGPALIADYDRGIIRWHSADGLTPALQAETRAGSRPYRGDHVREACMRR
jgi:hypothetical protein